MADHRPFRFAVQSFSAASGAEWRDKAKQVEDFGYSALHLADHFLGPGPALDATRHPHQELAAVPAIAAAAAATTTLRVGCRVFCIDYRLPVVLAKEAATLDLLSDGRLELGLGAGWLQGEYEAAGIGFDPPGARITRLAEVVAALKAFFTGDPLDVKSDAVNWSGFSGSPGSVQQPHPPIMIGGGGKRVLQLAAREADVVSLNFNNRSGVIGPDGVQSSTAERTAEKVRWVREAAGGRDIEIEVGAYFAFVTPNFQPMLEGMAKGLGLSAEEMARHPHALFGEADAVADELERRREAYGISYVTVGDDAMEAFAPVVKSLTGR